jgi:hypothetical protein
MTSLQTPGQLPATVARRTAKLMTTDWRATTLAALQSFS